MYRIFLICTLFCFSTSASICYAQGEEQQKVSGHTAYINGMVAFENEEYQDAIKLFSEAYTTLPNSSGITFALADAYLQIGDLSNASYYAKQAVGMEPENKWYRYKLAEIYRLAGQHSAAIDEYQAIIQFYPEELQALQQLANIFQADNKLLEANRIYDKLLTGSDTDLSLRLEKAKNYLKLGMKDSAATELQQIQDLDPKEPELIRSLSDLHIELGNTAEAERILAELSSNGKKDTQSKIKQADIFADQNSWERALNILDDIVTDPLLEPDEKLTAVQYMLAKYNANPSNNQIINATTALLTAFTKTEPDYARAHSLAAKFYLQTDQPEKAQQALNITTQLQPLDDEAWKQRLQLLISQKDYKKVLELAPQAEENIPQDPFILYFVGVAHLELNNFKLAENKLNEATRYPARRSFKSQLYTALGKTKASQSMPNAAKGEFEQALKLDQDNVEAMEHLGNIYDTLGNAEMAKKWWQKALEKDPARSHLKQKILQ